MGMLSLVLGFNQLAIDVGHPSPFGTNWLGESMVNDAMVPPEQFPSSPSLTTKSVRGSDVVVYPRHRTSLR